MRRKLFRSAFCLATALAIGLSNAWAAENAPTAPKQGLPRPDGKPADMSKPVQVFILMGQSNMLGMGKIAGDKEGTLEYAVKTKKKYPYLVDDAGKWTERKDVRNVRVMVGKGGGMQLFNNEWLTIKGKTIGPEIGIGHFVGEAVEAPVMILKSCIGNRSLGWDLLPPGSKGYEFTDKDKKTGKEVLYTYAGYKETPLRWEKGRRPSQRDTGGMPASSTTTIPPMRRKSCRSWTSITPARRSTKSPASSSGRATRTATTPRMPPTTSRISSSSSNSCARTSTPPARSSSAPHSARPRRATRATSTRRTSLKASSRWTGIAASIPSSRAMWPRSIPTPCRLVALQQPLRRQRQDLYEHRRSHGPGHGRTAEEQVSQPLPTRCDRGRPTARRLEFPTSCDLSQMEEVRMHGTRGRKAIRVFTVALVSVAFATACHPRIASGAKPGSELIERYTGMLNQLRTELTAEVPQNDQAKADTLKKFLASDALDAKLVKYVVLLEATPARPGGVRPAGQGAGGAGRELLSDAELMKQMLVADGANAKREGDRPGTVRPGDEDLHRHPEGEQESHRRHPAATGLAISLEHAVPIAQANPKAQTKRPTP